MRTSLLSVPAGGLSTAIKAADLSVTLITKECGHSARHRHCRYLGYGPT